MEEHILPFLLLHTILGQNAYLFVVVKTENKRNNMNGMKLLPWKMSDVFPILAFLDEFDIFFLVRILGNFPFSNIISFFQVEVFQCVLKIV